MERPFQKKQPVVVLPMPCKKTATNAQTKINYADGREESKKIDADAVDATNCGMVDLFVKMKHLVRNGSIDQETMNRELVLAHVYMQYRTPDANENTNINWVSWYEKRLELEMRSAGRNKHVEQLKELLGYLSFA